MNLKLLAWGEAAVREVEDLNSRIPEVHFAVQQASFRDVVFSRPYISSWPGRDGRTSVVCSGSQIRRQ